MISNLKYKPNCNKFQQQMQHDIKRIKSTTNVIINSDKTSNLYEIPADSYKKHLSDNVTNKYKKCEWSTINEINREAASLAAKLELDDRIVGLSDSPCYVTVKDHKGGFPGKLEFRLLNPSKTKIGIISKQILENINKKVREKTGSNQWRNTQEVLQWFNTVKRSNSSSFFKFDIENYYPTINKDVLFSALEFAKQFTNISEFQEQIIIHARKTFLFFNNCPWVKKEEPEFDVSMGSYDSAEISELVGLFLLHQVEKLIPQSNIGLYRDDGLAIVNLPGPQLDKLRKMMIKQFKQNGLRITVELGISTTNFLDVTLDLRKKTFKPYKKDNHDLKYIHIQSCHPPNVKKDLPKMIEKRISSLSSSDTQFTSVKNIYEEALKESGYKCKLSYKEDNMVTRLNKKRQRKRNILWFNPPFNLNVRNNVGSEFLKLVDNYLCRDQALKKHFNRNTIKISYSCMPNIQSIISAKNKKTLGEIQPIIEGGCNCRKGTDSCPVEGKCLTASAIYEAEVKHDNTSKIYVGMTSTSFKTRYSNHLHSFRNKSTRNTNLANHVWSLKDQEKEFSIKWKIREKAPVFNQNSEKCHLCTSEKYHILKMDKRLSLNKRSEIFTKCPHRKKYLLCNVAL